jgi:hypothetical protein
MKAPNILVAELYQVPKDGEIKSPEPVTGSGLEGQDSISRRGRFTEQSQQLGCAQS